MPEKPNCEESEAPDADLPKFDTEYWQEAHEYVEKQGGLSTKRFPPMGLDSDLTSRLAMNDSLMELMEDED